MGDELPDPRRIVLRRDQPQPTPAMRARNSADSSGWPGDIAVAEGASLTAASHVERALTMALSAEEQLNRAADSLMPTELPPVVRLTRQGDGAAEAG